MKNLADPTKVKDPKYRQLRLSNEKVQKKLLPCPSAVSYLEAIGFQKIDEDGSSFLRIVDEQELELKRMEASLLEITNALKILQDEDTRNGSTFMDEKKTPEGILIKNKPSTNNSATANKGKTNPPMSEKQKARLLMEQKRQREADDAKRARAKTKAMIKQDKYVRKHDKNWKSGVSAACMKSGEGISTFRDKYGEN